MNMNPKAVFLLFLLAITLSHSYRLQQIPYQYHPTTRCYYNFFYTCRPIYNPPYYHPANGAASTWWLVPTPQLAKWRHYNQRETFETPSANQQQQQPSTTESTIPFSPLNENEKKIASSKPVKTDEDDSETLTERKYNFDFIMGVPQRNQAQVCGRYECGHQCRVEDAAGDCIWDLPCLIKMRAKKLRCGENVFI